MSRFASARGPENKGIGLRVTGESLVSDGVRRVGSDFSSSASPRAKPSLLKRKRRENGDDDGGRGDYG